MKNKFSFLGILLIFSALSACQTTQPGSPEAIIKAAEKAEEVKVEAAEQIVSDMPDWCLNIPGSDNALFACGMGESSNLNMSRTRATLDAKRQLADMIDSEISSRMEDFLNSVGTGDNEQIQQQSEIITKNVTIEAKLTGYRQVQAEAQNIGSKFQVYVLLEYPVGKANQALVNQIRQDEILSTQEAADAALAELEAEINKKKNN
jgi:hypothetical protein